MLRVNAWQARLPGSLGSEEIAGTPYFFWVVGLSLRRHLGRSRLVQ
jgi:hypothetical protein